MNSIHEKACRKYQEADRLKWEEEFHPRHDVYRYFYFVVCPILAISVCVLYWGADILNAMDLTWFDVGLK